jgi:hypothetical protein
VATRRLHLLPCGYGIAASVLAVTHTGSCRCRTRLQFASRQTKTSSLRVPALARKVRGVGRSPSFAHVALQMRWLCRTSERLSAQCVVCSGDGAQRTASSYVDPALPVGVAAMAPLIQRHPTLFARVRVRLHLHVHRRERRATVTAFLQRRAALADAHRRCGRCGHHQHSGGGGGGVQRAVEEA